MLYSFDQSQLDEGDTAEHLMSRVKERDEKALAELHRRHAPVMRGVIGRIINNDGDIDDIIQDVLLDIWNHAESYSEEKGSALGWMITIARRRAIDKMRSKQSYFRMHERVRMEPVGEAYQHICEEVNSGEVRGIFKKLMSQLPSAQREALYLSYFSSLSQREIAAQTGMPLGTIKTRIELALRKVRAGLQAFNDFKGWWPSGNITPCSLKR
jgi:RNA polymerase sigma-70 factor (ECF subfamily)